MGRYSGQVFVMDQTRGEFVYCVYGWFVQGLKMLGVETEYPEHCRSSLCYGCPCMLRAKEGER